MEVWCGYGEDKFLTHSSGGFVIYPSACLTTTALFLVDLTFLVGVLGLLLVNHHQTNRVKPTPRLQSVIFSLVALGLSAVR